ncbi:high frequency lysogenization protein HflD [Aliiglaciecola sp. LCG003]|uniref:high frequency lysogenization protein HflD n=1 Tax=Aliiglaciecola sp. LCG003 TaxID=3053655 RepID=UPI00257223A9|nr:high frequency lysogenization protein HflD [Aliiglaciecola sp. LCG003]WJG11072.1 high frequency lysogenization protein HflD [Aliiglaciecola sp. LCG003]
MNTEMEKNIALAGVCQAAALVQMIARKGNVPQQEFEASLNSIILTEPESTLAVFGEVNNLRVGFNTLISQLGSAPIEKDAEITRYIASILGLERKLKKHPKKMQELSQRMTQIQRQVQHVSLFEDQMVSNLASVYVDVVSPLGAKIQVAGTPSLLKQTGTQHKIRALLLAGVRAAVLWRQLGGQRRQILFNRKKIVASALELQQLTQHSI